MKALVFFLLFPVFTIKAQQNADLLEVQKNMQLQQKAWNKFNLEVFMNYYWKSDSLKFIGSKGINYGWQKTLDNYKKSYPTKEAMGILSFTIIEATQLSATHIYVIGKWDLKKETSADSATNKPAGGYFTLLWRKINSNWVVVTDHTS